MFGDWPQAFHIALTEASSISSASKRLEDGSQPVALWKAPSRSGVFRYSRNAAAASGLAEPSAIPRPWVSTIGLPASLPLPNTGITIDPILPLVALLSAGNLEPIDWPMPSLPATTRSMPG